MIGVNWIEVKFPVRCRGNCNTLVVLSQGGGMEQWVSILDTCLYGGLTLFFVVVF